MRSLIKYIVLILVVVGIGLVIRNVVLKSKNAEDTFINNKNNGRYYQVTVSLLDKENDGYINGSVLSIETEDGKVIEKWTTKNEDHVITNLAKGKYLLKQVSAAEGYDYNEDDTVFTITDKNLKLVMYNVKTGSEGSTSNGNNGSSNVNENVGVVDTLSLKNPLSIIFGSIVIIAGTMLLIFNKKLLN